MTIDLAGTETLANYLDLVTSLLAGGRRDEAEEILARATTFAGDAPTAHLILGLFLAQYREFERAEAHLQRAAEPAEQSEPAVAAVAHFNLGVLRRLQEDVAGSDREFARALALSDDDRLLEARADLLLQEQRYADALADLDELLRRRPRAPELFARRGELHRLCERYQPALDDLTRAVTLADGDGWAYATRGQVHKALEQCDEALRDLDAALARDPSLDWARAERGELRQFLGLHEQAIEDFSTLVAHESEQEPSTQRIWAYVQRGETLRVLRRFEEALADLNEAVRLSDGQSWVYAYRGMVLQLCGRQQEAIDDFNRALDGDANDDWTHYCRGLSLRILGRGSDADADFDQAIALARATTAREPRDWRTVLNLALYLATTGRIAEARRIYAQARADGASIYHLRGGAEDAQDVLMIFPGDAGALAALAALDSPALSPRPSV